MVRAGLTALLVGLCCAQPQRAAAIGAGDADTLINGFNNAFLMTSGNTAHYKTALNNTSPDYFWVQALDIQGEEDAYERTGNPAQQTLIVNLLNTFLNENYPSSWSTAEFNDDLGWTSLALIRGYQMTNNGTFLSQAQNAFNGGYNQGWDTQYNGGGIWYDNGNKTEKTALSNDSLGKAACLIYQTTGDTSYLNKAKQIYDWVWHNLYNSSTGLVYTQISPSGAVDQSYSTYNQGTFIDFANLLYQITGQTSYYNDAKRTIDYTKVTVFNNGVIYHNDGNGGYTWADEFARGLGHFVRDNRLWSTYYSWMVTNADAIMSHRRTDYNLTNNYWTQQTPTDNTQIPGRCVSAVAWLQYTPATQPNNIGGVHLITSKLNGIAIDNKGIRTTDTANPAKIYLWGNGGSQNQKWNFRQNSDTSWFITSMSSFQPMDNTGSTANGTQMIQYNFNGGTNQRWWVDVQSDGSYKIWSQAAGNQNQQALDSGSATANGSPLLQWGWSGGTQQRWLLQ